MINCVCYGIAPARSNHTGTQYGVRDHTRHIISKLISSITNSTNRFMQCRQNTVVSLMGSIQHCILCITGRITPACEKTYSYGITQTKRNVRCNIHDNLAQVRKSEKSLQYFNGYAVIDTGMCDNCDNCDNNFTKRLVKDHNTSTHMTYGRDYSTIKTSGIIAQIMILCANFSFIHADIFYKLE